MKRLTLAAAVAASMVQMTAYALLEVSSDYTITGDIDPPIVFTGDATLTIAENVYASQKEGVNIGWAITNNGHTVTINLENGSKTKFGWIETLNGGTTKVNFKGGLVTDAGGWGSKWFVSGAGSMTELVGVDGHPIWITHPNSQHKYLHDGGGRLITSGTGQLYVQTANIHNGTILYFRPNIPTTNNFHTGGVRFTGNSDGGAAWIAFTAADQFPPGRVEIGRAANAGGAWVNLNGTSQTAEEVVRIGAFGGITNMSGTASTLVFKKAGSVLDCPVYGNVNVQKAGTSTTLTVKRGPISNLIGKEGTILVKPDTSGATVKVGGLRVYSGATLTVDGCTLEADTADIGLSSVVTCVNGGKLSLAAAANKTNVVDAMSWSGASLEKTGAGTLGLGSDTAVSLNAVNVAAGTLMLGRLGDTNRFWRVSFKSTKGGSKLALGPFRLYDRSRSFTDGGHSGGAGANGYSDKSSAGITASQLAAKQFICSRSDYLPNRNQSGSNYRSPEAMFYNSTVYSCMFTSTPYPSVGNPASWVVMTYRIPNTAAATYGYDVRSQWEGVTNHPGTWTLESSPDGTDGSWQLVDEKSGQAARVGQCWYHGDVQGDANPDPFTFQTLRAGGGGISPTANVKVAAGATLDATLVDGGQEVSRLVVDCTAGGGTLKGVKLASGGTLNLVNLPAGTKLTEYAVPLTFEDAGGTTNARTWKVQVDGVANRAKLTWQNGGLFVPSAGTIVTFR